MNKTIFAVSLACATILPAHAQESSDSSVRSVLGVGFTFGGEKLDNGSMENNDLRAGKGLLFVAGLDMLVAPSVSLQGTIGYHIDAVNRSAGGTSTFQRVPVELLAFYHATQHFRIGGGLRYASNAKVDFGNGNVIKPDSNVGAVIEGEFLFNKHFGLKLRAVSEKFDGTENYGGRTYQYNVRANHVGAMGSFYF